MAEATVNTLTLTLKSGWLQNPELPDENIVIFPAVTNVNTVSTAAVVEFTPLGVYSDGSHHLCSMPVSKAPMALGPLTTLW
jgi:hypothetical protein